MEETIKFEKSLEDRLTEFNSLFLDGKQSVSDVQKRLSSYLELVLNGLNGWHAIWKTPQLTCHQYNMHYPSEVLVYVTEVDCTSLTGTVNVIAVKDHTDLPDSIVAKLIHLFPTKNQDAINDYEAIYTLADSLEMFRFFYNRILMPWDYDSDDACWLCKHFTSRVKLFYDIRSGLISRQIAEEINTLISDAKDLYAELENANAHLDNETEDVMNDTENESVKTIICLQFQLTKIKNRFEILENPLLREAQFKIEDVGSIKQNKTEPEMWVVSPEGTLNEHIEFFKDVAEKIGDRPCKLSSNLIDALYYGDFNDTFILNAGHHAIKKSGAIEGGGMLKGLGNPSLTTIFSNNKDTMLECSDENVVIENITFDASSSKYGIAIRKGKVTIKNCILIGSFGFFMQQGITVFPGSKLEIFDSEISGFSTAIVGSSHSTILLKDCKLFSVNIGLQIFDDCKLVAQKTNFSNCSKCGIYFETEHLAHNVGNFSILEDISNIEIESVSGDRNSEDVIIHEKSKMKLLHSSLLLSEEEFSDYNDEVEIHGYEGGDQPNQTVMETLIE